MLSAGHLTIVWRESIEQAVSIPKLSHLNPWPPVNPLKYSSQMGPGYPARWSYLCLLFRDYFYKGTPSGPNSMILFPGLEKCLLLLFFSRELKLGLNPIIWIFIQPLAAAWNGAEIFKKFQLGCTCVASSYEVPYISTPKVFKLSRATHCSIFYIEFFKRAR